MTPRVLVLLLAVTLCICASVNVKGATRFNDISVEGIANRLVDMSPLISKNGILSIAGTSLNTEFTHSLLAFNSPVTGNYTAINLRSMSKALGYLLQQDGNILPDFIGILKAASLHKKQLRSRITAGILTKKLLIAPMVNISYLDYKAGILCEDDKPAVINL